MTTQDAAPESVTSASLSAVERYGAALAAGDMGAFAASLHPTVVWHQPGTNPLSGAHAGADAVLALLGSFMQLSAGSFALETTSVSVNGDYVATAVHFSAEREARTRLDQSGIDVFRVADGLIAEVWLFSADQAAEDLFWS